MTRYFVVAAALVSSCAVADPTPFDTVTVAFGPSLDPSPEGWAPGQLTALRSQLGDVASLGIRWVEASEGDADVVVRPFDSGPQCQEGAGRYFPGHAYVEVDPACTPGYDALRRAVTHELVHFWTSSRYGSVLHICPDKSLRADCSQFITCDNCVMSRGLVIPGAGPSTEEAWDGDFVDPDPTAEDIAFVAHCHAAGRCE